MNMSCKEFTRVFQIIFTINILVIFLFIIRISGLADLYANVRYIKWNT